MAISPPNFQKDAIPTPAGWRHPRTNELLISRGFTAEEIDSYNSPVEETMMLKESPTTMDEVKDMESMSKRELEAMGREHGIELDRRKNKDDLIEELKEAL